MIIVLHLHLGDKDCGEIQLIITSTKMINLAKQTIDTTGDLAIMARKKEPLQHTPRSGPNRKCFNYDKKNPYARDCLDRTNPKRKLEDEKAEQEAKHTR